MSHPLIEAWERWTEKRYHFQRDPEQPLRYESAVRLSVGQVGRFWLPSGHIVLPPVRGGARLFDRVDDVLNADSAPITGYPFTMAGWGKTSQIISNQSLIFIADKDVTDHYFDLIFGGGIVGDPLRFLAASGGTTANADTSTGYSADTWHHACAVGTSATDRAVFIDGGSKGTNATSRTPTGLDRISVGARNFSGAPSTFFGGDAAEIAVWNVALSDADVALAAKPVTPFLVHPESLVFYLPIIGQFSPEIDIVGGLNLALTSAPTASPHPRVFYMPQPELRRFTTFVAPPPPPLADFLNPKVLGVEVWDGADLKAWITPIVQASTEENINQVGRFSFTMPAGHHDADEMIVGREVRVFRESEGNIFTGRIAPPLEWLGDDGLILKVNGTSLSDELRWASTYMGIPIIDKTLSAAVDRLLESPGAPAWTKLITGAGYVNLTRRFDNKTLWEAFRELAEIESAYIRETTTARQIEFKNTSTASGKRLINLEHAPVELDADTAIITALKKQQTGEIINRLVPRGLSLEGVDFDLNHSDRTAPYTIQTDLVSSPSIANSATAVISVGSTEAEFEVDVTGKNRHLVIAFYCFSADSFNQPRNVTVGGKPYRQVANYANGTRRIKVYSIVNPAEGKQNITMQFSQALTNGIRAIAIVVQDASQIQIIEEGLVGSQVSQNRRYPSAPNQTATVTRASAAGRFVLDFMALNSADSATPGADQTLIASVSNVLYSSYEVSADASTDMTWDLPANNSWISVAIDFDVVQTAYIEDQASIDAYDGPRTKMLITQGHRFPGGSSDILTDSANSLYDAAVTYLQKVKDPQVSYDVQVEGLDPDGWLVGDSLEVEYRRVIDTDVVPADGTTILRPNANGTYEQWNESQAGDDYAHVDEVTSDGDTTYIQNGMLANPDAIDSFNIESLAALNVSRIKSVKIHFIGRRIVAEAVTVAPFLRSNSTDVAGTQQAMTGSFAEYTQTWTANPATGAPWTLADITALQIGVKAGASVNDGARVTQVWATITWRSSDRLTVLDVDEALIVLGRTMTYDETGARRMSLLLSNVYLHPRDFLEVISGELKDINDMLAT